MTTLGLSCKCVPGNNLGSQCVVKLSKRQSGHVDNLGCHVDHLVSQDVDYYVIYLYYLYLFLGLIYVYSLVFDLTCFHTNVNCLYIREFLNCLYNGIAISI